MKQISKRVSAALLAVLMGLSLLPQTVLALDPDQRQAERREGYDVATVHYTDAKGDEQAIPFTETGSGYVYTLPQGVTEDKVTVEYFSTTRWDGAVDISWYNDIDKEFTLTTPAQLAGLAALVAGQTSAETSRWRIKGDISRLVCQKIEDYLLVGAGGGNSRGTLYLGSAQYDFADKTVRLACDMDMGGVKAADGTWSGPNWSPIGGRYPMDITVSDPDREAQAFLSQSYFNGTLDGQGHRIENLYCDRYSALGFPYSQAIGLVGKLNVDGCFILRNGKYPELGMAADLTGSDPVLTVVLKDSQGNVTGEQSFTARQLSGLSQTGAVGYQYWKKGTENLVAATKYVTLETLLKAAGADFTPGMTVTAADATGFGSTLSYQDYQTCRWAAQRWCCCPGKSGADAG